MTVVNNASVIFKDKNGNVGKVKAPSANDITKISTAISDVAQVVDPTSHIPIQATTSSVGVVQLADAAAVAAGTAGRIVDAAQLKDAIEHVTPAGNLMTLNTSQTVTAVKTFSSLPESSVVPTTDNQLVNKKYVDDHTPTGVVDLTSAQTISGLKTFSTLPQSSVAPSTGNDLVNKTYADTKADIEVASTYTEPSAENGILSPSVDRLTTPTYSGVGVKPALEYVIAASPTWYRRAKQPEVTDKTKVTIYANTQVNVNGDGFITETDTVLDVSLAASWDETATTDYTVANNRKGKDFYIYACENDAGDTLTLKLSANSTVPEGYTASTSRKIGGFHCLCAAVGTPTWYNPATLTTENHKLAGYVAGDILPGSIWDLLHRAASDNEGMVYSEETKEWYDIYLAAYDGAKLVSGFGLACADGASSKKFHGEMFAECAGQVGKELVSRDKFIVVAKGSNERTSIYGSADAGTTGGHVDTSSRRMISNIGLEDCCGFMWQWCRQAGGANGSSGWNNSVSAAAVDRADARYGQSYGSYYRALVGGCWLDSSYCGSRCVSVANVSADVDGVIGGRLSSPERVVAGL